MDKETEATALLRVENLKQHFVLKNKSIIKAVDGVSFEINKGEVYGLVGESGSGKSTIGRSIIRIYEPTSGSIFFDGRDISGRLGKKERRKLTTEMQMIFQDPMASLNPQKRIIDIIAEGLDAHRLYENKKEREEKVLKIMERVGLDADQAYRYPHQFSGGQRQRVGIARAFVLNPKLVIADEAISALDVSVQAQVVNLMKDLKDELGTTYLFIAHDLAMVKYISDRIGVLHLGHLVETGSRDEIFDNPIHPYTRSLLSAIPVADPEIEREHKAIEYDYAASGIDYEKGEYHHVSGSHYVLGEEKDIEEWLR